MPGKMKFVSSSEAGIVWAIDLDNDVWILKTGTVCKEEIIDNTKAGWILVEQVGARTLV